MKNSDKQDDRQVFRQLANNSEKALGEIQLRYTAIIARYIRRYIRNDDELIKEIISDVLLATWKQRATVVYKEYPVRWMMRIAHNLAINKFRKDGVPLTEPLDSHIDLPDQADADSGLKVHELEGALLQFAADLPQAERDVFIRSKMEGMDNDEIAAQLGISRQTVKNELSRAVVKLRPYLKALGYLLIMLIFNS